MPYFAATKMSRYPGLTGLFIAGIFSASLSTISAMLNSLSAVFLEDYLKPIYVKYGKRFPEDKTALFGKIIGTLHGFVCLGVAFLARNFGSLIQMSLSITGSICGPILGIFTLGIFFEGANENGATLGMFTALFLSLWASFGGPKPKIPMLPISTDGCNFTLPVTLANMSTIQGLVTVL